VWSWGSNAQGQLGIGFQPEWSWRAVPVLLDASIDACEIAPDLSSSPIVHIACGLAHCLALSGLCFGREEQEAAIV